MKTKTIFLLFVIGASAVLAEKVENESSSEEENSNENINGFEVNVQSNDGVIPEGNSSKLLTPAIKLERKKNLLLFHTRVKMNDFVVKASQRFRKIQKNIEDKKEQYKDNLKLNLKSVGNMLDKLKEEIEKKQNTTEIQKCLNGYYFEFESKMDETLKNDFNCFDNALQEAKDFIERFLMFFYKTFIKKFEDIEAQTMITESCQNQKKRCLRERITATNEKIIDLINSTNYIINKTKQTLEIPNRNMDECRNEFIEKLSRSMQTCTISMKSCENKEVNDKEDDKKEEENFEDDQKGREEEEKVEDDKKEEENFEDDQKGKEEEKVEDDKKEEENFEDDKKGREEEKVEDDKKEEENFEDDQKGKEEEKVELLKEEKAKFEEKR